MKKIILVSIISLCLVNFAYAENYKNDTPTTFTGGQEVPDITTSGATLEVDFSVSNYQIVRFNQDCAVTVTNLPSSGKATMFVNAISANSYTVTFEGKTLSLTTSNELIALTTVDGGTTVDALFAPYE